MFFQKTVYQLRERQFDKLDSFNVLHSGEQKLLKNMAIFDFDTTFLQEDEYPDTGNTTWIGKQVPKSVSFSCNLIQQPIFLCNSSPAALVASFVAALDVLATQSKVEMNRNFWRLRLV